MFALDAIPDVEDAEKLQYVYNAPGQSSDTARSRLRQDGSSGSAEVRRDDSAEPYILVSRGEDFADSNDVWSSRRHFRPCFLSVVEALDRLRRTCCISMDRRPEDCGWTEEE
jgi:hypothetical protein